MHLRPRPRGALGALLLLALLLGAAPLGARPSAPQAAPDRAAFANSTDRLIVHTREGGLLSPSRARPAAPDAVATRLSGRAGVSLRYLRAGSAPDTHLLQLPENLPLDAVEALAAQIAADPEVTFVEPDRRVFVDRVPNDPFFSSQLWHLQPLRTTAGPGAPLNYGANLPAAWAITTGSPDVVAAVIDTGGLLTHQDLAGRTPDGNPGYDMIGDPLVANDGGGRDADPSDPGDWVTGDDGCGPAFDSSWHGSHVAGTIGAASDNGVGVTGVSWGSKLLHVRALGKCGGYNSDIADAIRWASGVPVAGVPNNPNPARVINMSLGGNGVCTAQSDLQLAINAAVARGTVIVVAAGNEDVNLNLTGGANDVSPAECAGVITVAATARNGQRASYSNYGSAVALAAPGGDGGVDSMVVSTINTGTTTPLRDAYAAYEGTSMAAPHVAGTVALMLSVNPSLTNAEVLDILRRTATPFPAGSCTTSICGAGILNAGAAVETVARELRTLSWVEAAQTVNEGAGLVRIRAQLSAPSGQPITIPYTVSGTADAADFTLAAGTLTFPAGSTLATLSFPLLDDSAVEGAETISVQLGTPQGSPAPAQLSGPAAVTITILDNEGGEAAPTLSLGQGSAGGTPGQVSLSFTVQRQGAGAVGASYLVRAAGSATVAAEGDVRLAAGESSKQVTVTFQRGLIGNATTIELQLVAPTGGALLGSPASRQFELPPLRYLYLPSIRR